MLDIVNNLGESRIAAIYNTQEDLERSKTIVFKKLGISEQNVEVISPSDAHTSEKLGGNSKAIGKSMWNLHLAFGFGGVLVGMGLAFILVEFGPAFTSQNPMFTYIALISPGLFIGLFLAGLLSLKPQHDQVNISVAEHKNEQEWTLIIDTADTKFSKQDVLAELKDTETVAIHQ